jgi:hypothetical protein
MCEATTIAVIGLALTAASGYTQYEGQKAQGKYNEAVAENNAKVADAQAQQALQKGSIDEDRQRAKVRQVIGAQRTALAANNVQTSSGTALDLIGETAQMGEDDALTIRANAARDAWGFKAQATDFRNQGVLAAATAKNAATGTLLTTGANVAGQGYSYYKSGAFSKQQKTGSTV